jgi:serine/threonine protein kinase
MYDLLSPLGTNGITTVYKARDVQSNRLVALKIIESKIAGDEVVKEGLRREGRLMAFCQHPGILKVFAVGELDGRACLAMELAEGGNLSSKLDTPWAAWQAVEMAARITQAVEHVHKQGLVHRAISVRHVFLTKNGKPKLGGFGAARAYRAKDVGAVAEDLHGLGTLLYCLLTAPDPPGKDPTQEVLLPEAAQPPTVPEAASSARLPRELESICFQCLGMHPTRRYNSVAELDKDLNRFLNKQILG